MYWLVRPENPVYLYWFASTDTGHYLDNLCRSWEDAFDDFYYYPLQSNHIADELDSHLAESIVTKPDQWQIYSAGPAFFIEEVANFFDSYNVPESQQSMLMLS